MTNKNPFCESNPIRKIFGIKYPIIQGGMVWVSGPKLAAAVSNAGCLGLLGAGSMKPDLFEENLKKLKSLTDKPFGVNIPIFTPYSAKQIEIALRLGVKNFFTSAGNPKEYTSILKSEKCKVAHVVSSPKFAIKSQESGVDLVVAEGFEAGGHNGREEITTMCLIPQVVDCVDIPVVAAGGIADARGVLASFALGALGVQMGTRFVLTTESSAHENFKKLILKSSPGSTKLLMKKSIPVRLLENKLTQAIQNLEDQGASSQTLSDFLGKGKAKAGMFEGDIENGELEIGQIASMIHDIPTTQQVVDSIVQDIKLKKENFNNLL